MTINIGLDLGMGAIKIYADNNKKGVLPSFTSIVNGDEFSAGDGLTSSKVTKITFDNQSYYVGRNAHSHGRPLENLDYERLLGSPEIKALFYGAMAETFGRQGIPTTVSVRAGLPIELLKGSLGRSTATKVREWLLGTHEWSMGRDELHTTVSDVKIASQPTGALADYVMDEKGKKINNTDSIGFVSVGFNTTEIMAVEGGQVNQSMSNGGTHGVRRLLELCNLDGGYTLGELDNLRHKSVLDVEDKIPVWAREVKGAIEREWGTKWHRFNRIVMVGGGSIILKKHLMFDGKSVWPDDPIISIARGLWKSTQRG